MTQENITIPSDATLASIKKQFSVPRGATHFRLSFSDGSNPVIDKLKNIDVVRGCTGTLEFGKAKGTGVGKHYRITGFESLSEQDPAPAKKASSAKPAQESKADLPKQQASRKRHGDILGHSVCSVIKALGQAGVKYPEADAILKARGIEMPKASVSVQLGFGRNEKSWERHGKPAPLAKEQLAELRAESS